MCCSGLRKAPTSLGEEHGGGFRDLDGDPPFIQPLLEVTELGFQVFNEQRRPTGRWYDGRVVCVECQLYVARAHGNVVDIQA